MINFFYDSDIIINIFLFDQYIAGFMLIGGFGHEIDFVLLEISIRNRIRKFYCRFFFLKHNFYHTRLANLYIPKSTEHILIVTYDSSFP